MWLPAASGVPGVLRKWRATSSPGIVALRLRHRLYWAWLRIRMRIYRSRQEKALAESFRRFIQAFPEDSHWFRLKNDPD